jgi:two-component system phosphate regulon sensor histidine kinase PhoR
MDRPRTFPWFRVLLALVAGALLIVDGASYWLVGIVVLAWLATLWRTAPEDDAVRPQPDSVQLTREGMRDMIEQFSLPLLLLDANRIVIANSAARVVFGKHIVGQDARVALRHPQAVALLDRPDGGSVTVQGLTTPRSIWQVTRHAINDRYWVIELHNRTAEADISRAHTDFVANASHELRTPLASIIGYVETLADEDGALNHETARKFLDTVLREAKRLQSLVSDLMSLSRIEAEKHDLPSAEVDLAKVVAKAAKEGGGPGDKARIKTRIPDAEVPVRGDEQQLEQLVRNLADNALKYGAPDTPVDVALTIEDGRAVIKVTDRGEGIAPEHIPHLTRRFYRTDPGRSRQAGGTGLGLAIVKHIVERHRGRLDIESKRGEGTVVTVRLPIVDNAA